MATFKRLKNMNRDIEYTVFGYIRNEQNLLTQNVPFAIQSLFILYYDDNYVFDKNNHSQNIQIIDNGKSIKKLKCPGFGQVSCIFGQEISDKICNKFNIKIKWTNCCSNFYFGFITSSIKQSINNWDQPLGRHLNKQHSVAILIGNRFNHFILYDKHNERGKKLEQYISTNNFDQDDTFNFIFDFLDDSLSIYHNDIYSTKISLNGNTKITAGFSLGARKYEEIKVIKCLLS